MLGPCRWVVVSLGGSLPRSPSALPVPPRDSRSRLRWAVGSQPTIGATRDHQSVWTAWRRAIPMGTYPATRRAALPPPRKPAGEVELSESLVNISARGYADAMHLFGGRGLADLE